MHSSRFVVPALALLFAGCGGSDLSIDDQIGEADTAGESATADGAGDDSAIVDSGADDASATDSSITDSSAADSATLDTGTPADTTPTDTSSCPPLALGGATEDVYVDKSVTVSGNGTTACPFKTILAATSLAAPGTATTLRTIHVKGSNTAPDYVESGALVLQNKVTLTSNYDSTSTGGVATVRITARGDCSAVAGVSANCAVGMHNGSRIELVTVRSVSGASTGHAVLTTNVLPPTGVSAPVIVDVNAENANEAGIRAYGSVTVGPRVRASNNKSQGLNATRPSGAAQSTVKVVDAPSLTGAPSNTFANNSGTGIVVFGDIALTVEGASTTSNTASGILIGVPLSATAGTTQHLSNIQSTTNGAHGLRVVSGEVRVHSGTWTNTFNNNRQYGVHSTLGDSIGGARLIFDPKKDTGGNFLVGHQADNNVLGGVLLNQSPPTGTAPHSLSSVEANNNGTTGGALAYGIFVQCTGANQPSLILRGSTLLTNSGGGLRYQQSATNTLDVGTVTTGGYNIWGSATSSLRNGKTAICYENLTTGVVTQTAETDRWSQACPLPLGSGGFQSNVGTCGSNGGYVEVTYTGTTAPFAAVAACY